MITSPSENYAKEIIAWRKEKVLELDGGDGCPSQTVSTAYHCTAYFKMGYEVETRKEWEK